MRFLVQARIPAKVGNAALLDGTMMPKMQKYLEAVRPEAVYMADTKGQRTMFFVVQIDSPDQLPAIGEPLWLDWQAEVEITPVMTPADLEKAGPALQRLVQARK